MVNAVWRPVAVFDETGACLAASQSYVLHSTSRDAAAHPQQRVAPFSPDGVRQWSLVTLPTDGAETSASEFIDTIADAMPLLFNAKDRQRRYLFMNRFQAELYGITPQQAVGHPASAFVSAEQTSFMAAIDEEVMRTGRAKPFFEHSFTGADGVTRTWLSSKIPLLHPDGEVWGVASVALDITERKRLEDGWRTAKEDAESGSRAKSRFLAGMSHELRTPLNAVLGFAELMQQEALGPLGHPDYNEYAGHILSSGTQLLELIGDLLDFSRADAGNLELSLTEVELTRLVRGGIAAARERVETGHRKLNLTLATNLPPGFMVVRGDEQRLRQMLRALLSNALKFTPAGGTVTVALRRMETGCVELSVTDTGIGMTEQEQERAFEPFWQADGSLDRRRGGAGIGLQLTRELAALHGGTLTMHSRKGEGTRVAVRLPAAPPPPRVGP